ncbi:MAG: phage head closure protein [Rhizobiaceae bacterium]|nr:phage head closure protein [Rhizobiaceae bacterium]
MKVEFINPGQLRHEVALESPALTPDGLGGYTENWVETATVFARIEPMGTTSRFGAGQTREVASHRITIRHRSDVASGMRFSANGRIFAILTVSDPDETGRYLVCRTREDGL